MSISVIFESSKENKKADKFGLEFARDVPSR